MVNRAIHISENLEKEKSMLKDVLYWNGYTDVLIKRTFTKQVSNVGNIRDGENRTQGEPGKRWSAYLP